MSEPRTGSTPNPWEVAWLLWNYTDNEHFYYVMLKPNGLEIGKEDPAYPGNQRFLFTQTTPYPIGESNSVRVTQRDGTFKVWVNGAFITEFKDKERPYTSGAIGLYAEDSDVHFELGAAALGADGVTA